MTYRRPSDLADTLRALSEQSVGVDHLIVVDNDPAQSAAGVARGATYVAAGDNFGPAGGLAIGVATALEHANLDDWILFLDDDDPPQSIEDLSLLRRLALSASSDTGAVGKAGAWYDRATGRTLRPNDSDLDGQVEVDWIGGNQLPLYRVKAIKNLLPDASLFFGFDDLEFGLQLREAGWKLIVDGEAWKHQRRAAGRLGLSSYALRKSAVAAHWRRYYVNRNLILVARRFGSRRGHALCVLTSCARSIKALRFGLRASSMSARGTLDGLLGRRGRRVDPGY